jgi:glycosyltransferase involved in cell wall biosynthesis
LVPGRATLRVLRRAERLGLTGGTPWAATAVEDWRAQRQLDRALATVDVEAVIEIGDLGHARVPFFCYLDLSYAIANAAAGSPGGTGASRLPVRAQRRKERRQQQVLGRAAGVLAMGRWFADELIRSGYPAGKVHAVGAGLNAAVPARLREPDPEQLRLLFIGRDFVRKGGDVLVEALALLRASGAAHELTVVGPAGWPLPGPIPDGVRFLGSLPPAEVARLLDAHDALVMPSRFEAFGIAILEGLAAGMPVVGRRAFAMPELVPDGCGILVDELTPSALAAGIGRLASDPDFWSRSFAAAPEIRRQWSWDAVAGRVLSAVGALPSPG